MKEAKIKNISLRNFGAFKKMEVKINNNVTYLIGYNGAGKTTIGYTSIITAFKGIAERSTKGHIIGNRYRFIGQEGNSADIVVTIEDVQAKVLIEVKNHLTATKNGMSFEAIDAPAGYIVDEKWLYNLINMALLSANNFAKLTSKEQSLALGIDTQEYDIEIKKIKSEYTLLNKAVKDMGIITPVLVVEKVSIADLMKEKNVADIHNNTQKLKQDNIDEILKFIKIKRERIAALRKAVEKEEALIKSFYAEIGSMPVPLPENKVEDIISKINSAEKTNEGYTAYVAYTEKLKKKTNLETRVATNRTSLTNEETHRLDYIKKAKLPFKSLSIDEEGGLLLKGRPIKDPYFSAGELEKVVALIAKSQNPDLKLRFIDNWDLIDPNNQEDILTKLTESGFDVIVASVGDQPKGDNSIIIKDIKE